MKTIALCGLLSFASAAMAEAPNQIDFSQIRQGNYAAPGSGPWDRRCGLNLGFDANQKIVNLANTTNPNSLVKCIEGYETSVIATSVTLDCMKQANACVGEVHVPDFGATAIVKYELQFPQVGAFTLVSTLCTSSDECVPNYPQQKYIFVTTSEMAPQRFVFSGVSRDTQSAAVVLNQVKEYVAGEAKNQCINYWGDSNKCEVVSIIGDIKQCATDSDGYMACTATAFAQYNNRD